MTMPTPELKPGDSGYEELYAIWVAQGRPGTIERLALGYQYRAIHPTPTDETPTFVLVASAPLSDRDAEGPPQGYASTMGVRQSSLPGRRGSLTKD